MTIRSMNIKVQPNETKEECIEIPMNLNALSMMTHMSDEQIEALWLYIKGYVSAYTKKITY